MVLYLLARKKNPAFAEIEYTSAEWYDMSKEGIIQMWQMGELMGHRGAIAKCAWARTTPP